MKQFKHSYILLIITLFLCQHVYADDNVSVPTVAAVQGLVIVSDRRGFEPVKVGMRLMKGDEIKTGKRGKVYIDFPDNSRVKLGVNSRFKIKDWYKRKGIFYSTLSIIQGAFRYTAGLIGSGFKQRRTLINTTTAVLGVRGTDLWGRVDSGDTFFLLIEGKVSLKPKRGAEIEYNNAGAAVDISYSKVSQPEYLSSDNISSLAQETEIEQ